VHQLGSDSKRAVAVALLAALASLGVALVLADPTRAVQAAGSYSHVDDGDCKGADVDPVGLIFQGSNAGWENTAQSMIAHADWPFRGVGTGTQNLLVYRDTANSVCRDNNDGSASNCFGDGCLDRFHARLWLTNLLSKPKWTAGTPHWERWDTTCGHFVVDYNYTQQHAGVSSGGFTYARKRVKSKFEQDGHGTDAAYWGNTHQIDQCEDHGPVGSDGWVVFITINHDH
jgi:hypothetical protein